MRVIGTLIHRSAQVALVFQYFEGGQCIHATPAIGEVGAIVAHVVGRVEQGSFQQSGGWVLLAGQLAVGLVELGQRTHDAGGGRTGAAPGSVGIIGVGTQLVVAVGADVGLDAPVVGGTTTATAAQLGPVVEIARGDHVLPLLVATGNVAPLFARAVAAVVEIAVTRAENVHQRGVVEHLLIGGDGREIIARVAAVAVAAVGQYHVLFHHQGHRGIGSEVGLIIERVDESARGSTANIGVEIAAPGRHTGHHVAVGATTG